MTPDRPLNGNKEREKAVLGAILNLGQVATGYGQDIELMMARNRDHSNLPAGAKEQTRQIKSRLLDLSQLLIDLSGQPQSFSRAWSRTIEGKNREPSYELVFRRGSAGSSPTLYFKTTSGAVPRIYAAPLYDNESRSPFGDSISVPEISVFPAGEGVKSRLYLITGNRLFYFTDRWANTIARSKVDLLASFAKDYALR